MLQPPSYCKGGCAFTMLQFCLQEPAVHWRFGGVYESFSVNKDLKGLL